MPESIYQGISIYLLLAIGLKGGAVPAVTPPSQLLLPGAVTLAIGILTPVSAWLFMRKIGRLGTVDPASPSPSTLPSAFRSSFIWQKWPMDDSAGQR